MQAQLHAAATAGHERLGHLLEAARHQGEQVGGLGEGVFPDGVMARRGRGTGGVGLVRQQARVHTVAVGEQHRAAGAVGLDAHPEAAEQVGAIRVVGDAPETLRFALGGEQTAAHVQALEAAVGFRVDAHQAAQFKRPGRRLQQHQGAGLQPVGLGGQGRPIELQLQQLQLHPPQGEGAGGGGGVGLQLQAGLHQGVVAVEAHLQGGVGDQTRRRAVVGEANAGHGDGVRVWGLVWPRAQVRAWRPVQAWRRAQGPVSRQAPGPGIVQW